MKFLKKKAAKFVVSSLVLCAGAYFGIAPSITAPVADQLGTQAEEMVEG